MGAGLAEGVGGGRNKELTVETAFRTVSKAFDDVGKSTGEEMGRPWNKWRDVV